MGVVKPDAIFYLTFKDVTSSCKHTGVAVEYIVVSRSLASQTFIFFTSSRHSQVSGVEKKIKVWSNSHTEFVLHCPGMSWTK